MIYEHQINWANACNNNLDNNGIWYQPVASKRFVLFIIHPYFKPIGTNEIFDLLYFV